MSRTFLIRDGDFVSDVGGQLQTVTGQKKARQDIAETLAIAVQPSGQGAGIFDMVGSDETLDDGVQSNMEFLLRQRLETSMQRLISLQRQSLANRTPDEVFARILNIEASQDRVDPTLYRWRVDVQTLAGQVQTLSGRIGTGT